MCKLLSQKKEISMAFVSRNPERVLNPETAENYVRVKGEGLAVGTQIIGYFKNTYIEPIHDSRCYVLKGRDDGIDYLIYGCRSLDRDMGYLTNVNGKYKDRGFGFYTQGDLLTLLYNGIYIVKGGSYAGKPSHTWVVTAEDTWMPTPEFVSQLQQEVHSRRIEVQNLLNNTRMSQQMSNGSQQVPISNMHMSNMAPPDFGMQSNPSSFADNSTPTHPISVAPTAPSFGGAPMVQQPVSVAPMPSSFGAAGGAFKRKSVDPFG